MNQNMKTALGENSFPKISGRPKDFLKQLQSLKDRDVLPTKLVLEGTVKLHGSHADIVYDLKAASTEVTFQSRNRICAPTDSQQGWPRNLVKYLDDLTTLRDEIIARFQQLNPATLLDRTKPLIVAGEWIGEKVQKDVGVSELSHRFVVLTIQVNGLWQADTDYGDIEASAASIYNILRVPQYKVDLDTSDLTLSNPALLELQRLADEIEAECPFAASFGIMNSRGEGIVWKPGTPEGRSDARYWLKTKGPIIGPENRIEVASVGQDGGMKPINANQVQSIVAAWVTERRLEQAHEYLAEMGTDAQRRPKEFRKWVAEDILKEEATEIEELRKAVPGIEQILRRKVGELAGRAYNERLTSTGVDQIVTAVSTLKLT